VKDKEFTTLAIVAALVGIVWWLYERRQAQAGEPAGVVAGAFPASPWGPMDGVNPETFMPPNLSGLTINVPNQMANLLSNQMIPLFGFVGMAQGTFYQ
jgi:hypothetical protein